MIAKEFDAMVLRKYLAKSCILPHMLVAKKADAIKELTHLLFEKKRMKGVGLALDQVLAREVMESTGIGRGIAIPHARLSGLKTLICAVGRVPGGVDFAAMDHKPVQLIFLVFYPPTMQTTYLNFVATLVRLLRDPAHAEGLASADTPEGIYKALDVASEAFAENHEAAVRKIKADPALAKMPDTHADLILLARLQLFEEMLSGTRAGKGELRKRIDNVRSLIDERLLRHYDRLMKGQPPALVPVEAETCQGCFMRLPSKFAQRVRQDNAHVHTCPNCNRFIYVL